MINRKFSKNKHIKKHYIIGFFMTAVILATLLAVSKPFAQEISQYPNDERQMNQQGFQSNEQISSRSASNKPQIIHLSANEFFFENHVKFSSSVLTNPDKYAESITHDNNGALDITLINQGNTIKYLFQVSRIPEQQCEPDANKVCQQRAAAPARGNVAEIQMALQGSKLRPGTYTFEKGGATPVEEVMISSRQLYSDPSHGKLGCKAWGGGAFNIKRAVYNVNGKLEYLEASLFRVCAQTAPFPPTRPEDNLLQVEVENIEKYTYYASLRCHMKVAGE